MPTVTTSIAVRQNTPNESSRFRPSRDRDDVRQKYKDIGALQKQLRDVHQSNQEMARLMEKMRRRILGGIGGSSAGMNFRGEFDPTASYAVNDVVVIRAGSNAGSYVAIQASGNETPQLPDTGNLFLVVIVWKRAELGGMDELNINVEFLHPHKR